MKILSSRAQILLVGALLVSTSTAAENIFNHIFYQIELQESHLVHLQTQMVEHIKAENYAEAQVYSNELTDLVSKNLDIDVLTYARVLNNAAIMKAHAGEHDAAIKGLDEAISLTGATNLYHPDLFHMLMSRANIQLDTQSVTPGIESLRRAQHITHREDGVYAAKQLPIIKQLVSISHRRGQKLAADREQRFRLKVSENVYGPNSEDLMPTLEELGFYFASRGNQISINSNSDDRLYRDMLFRESIGLYKRSIAIIEDKYGSNDIRLVEPLRGLSQARFMQRSRNYHVKSSIERATNIVASNRSSDTSEIAEALVELGDVYQKTNDPRALDEYQKAWDLLSDKPEYEQLRHDLFGRPKALSDHGQYLLDRQPMMAEEGAELFVDLQYDIQGNGRVRNVKVLDGNVPNFQKKMLRDAISSMKYRPRIVDGEFSTIEGLSLHQTFRVLDEPAGKTSAIQISESP